MKKINQVIYQAGGKWSEPHEHPMIRIANTYLKKTGFNYGDKIEVEYKEGEINIKKIEGGLKPQPENRFAELEANIKDRNRQLSKSLY